MLAVLMLNRMTMKRQIARKQKMSKPVPSIEIDVPKVAYCRTCLGNDDLVSIFATKAQEKKRSHELRLVTGLEITKNDGLSQKICGKCIDFLTTSLEFRRTSKKAEKILLEMSPNKTKKKHKSRKKESKMKLSEPKQELEVEIEYNGGDDFQTDDYGDENGFTDTFPINPYDDINYGVVKADNNEDKLQNKLSAKRKRPALQNAPPYKCNTCNKEFKMKTTYKAHMRFHTNYCVCETCGKRCRNNNQLQEHKRARHGLGRIHKCAYCEYSSATKEALTIHERRHTGERPYVCDHCGATFHRRSNLVQHIAIHLPEKNFQCDMCPKRLKSRKFLQIHKHNAHTGKRYGYLCAVCEHRFEKPNKVRAHTRRVHGLPDDQQGPIVRVQL